MKSHHVLAAALALALAPPAFAAGGDVTAVVTAGGTLSVTGDSADNEISITPDGRGAFTVTGLNGTTVNLGASASLTGIHSIRVSLREGADHVAINGGRIRRNLRILLDDGNDTCILNNVRVRGSCSVFGGAGADHVVTAGNATFRQTLNVSGQGGDDLVELLGADCFGRTTVDGGPGADTINCRDSGFEDLTVRTGTGDDQLDIDDCDIDDDIRVDMGPDDDHVILDDTNFDSRTEINGGGGNDDNLSLRSGNDFSRRPRFRSFEE